MTRRARIALVSVGIAVALAVAGVSGWLLFEGAQGRDPFAFAAPALATTAEAEQGDRGTSSGDADDKGKRASSADLADGVADAGDATGDDVAQNAEHAAGEGGVAADGGADVAVGDAGAQTGANGGYEDDTEPAPVVDDGVTALTVSVTVDATPVGAGAYTRVVTLQPGATAYDALVASGAAVNARATGFGTYVAAIDGIAEREHGGMSGWVYAVDGVEPNTAASNYALSAGDVVTWTYVNVEY